jgi:hypothetical protein
MSRVWEHIASDVAVAILEEAGRHQRHAPDGALLAGQVRATMTRERLAVTVASASGNGMGTRGGALAGAGLGLVAGSVVPGIGNVIGAGVGAAVGYMSARKNQQERLTNAGAEIERAGAAAVDVLTGPDAAEMITATVMAACAGAAPPQPGEEKLTALRDARAALAVHADELGSQER